MRRAACELFHRSWAPTAIVALLVAAPTLLRADTIEWTNAVNGNFTTAGNWTVTSGPGPAPPAAGDTAVFNEAGTYTVTLSSSPVASDAVQVTAGTVTFRENAGGGAGVYNVTTGGADVTISGAGTTLNLGLVNDPATLNVGDDLFIHSGGAMNVNFGSDVTALDISVGTSGAGTISSLIVDGVGSNLNKTGINPASIGSNGATGALTLRNGASGDINATLSLASSNADSDGSLNVESNADLTLDTLAIGASGSFATALGSATVTGAGSTITQTGASTLTIGTAAGNVGELNVDAGGLYTTGTGASTILATGSLNINAGTFELRGTLNNTGLIETRNASTVRTGGPDGSTVTINNLSIGDVQNFTGTTTFALSSPTHVGVFNNQGIFDNQSNVSATTFQWQFNNSGIVEVAGQLNLNGGGTHTGSFEVPFSGTLQFGGGDHTFNGATFTLDPPNTGGQSVRFSAGNSIFSMPTTIDGDVELSGGMIRGTAQLTLTDLQWSGGRLAMSTSGGVTIPAGGKLQAISVVDLLIGGPSLLQLTKLNIDGTAEISGDIRATGGFGLLAAINVSAAAQLDLKVSADFEHDANSSGVITNAGTMLLRESAHTFSTGWTVNNTGTMTVVTGSSTATFSGPLNNHGLIEVEFDEQLVLGGGGSHTGDFVAETDGFLQFLDGVHSLDLVTFNPVSASNAGVVRFGSAGSNPTINLNTLSTFNLPVTIASGTFNNNVDTVFTAGATLDSGTLAGAGDLTFDGRWRDTKILMKNGARVTTSGLLDGNVDRELGSSDAGGTVTLAIKAFGSLVGEANGDVLASGAAGSVAVIEIPSTASVELSDSDIEFRRASANVTGVINNSGLFTVNTEVLGGNGIREGWTFNNAGTLRVKNNSFLSFTFAATEGTLNNSGTVQVQNGNLIIGAGASAGLFDVDAGGLLSARNHQFNGATFTNEGRIFLEAGNSFSMPTTIAGTLFIRGGNTFNAASMLTGSVEMSTVSSALLGAGQVTVNDLDWRAGTIGLTGGIVVAPDGLLRIAGGSQRGLAAGATLTLSSGAVLVGQAGFFELRTESNAPAMINVQPGAIVDLDGANFTRLNPSNVGVFNHAGLLRKSGAFPFTVGAGWEFDNSGLVLVQGGSMTFTDLVNAGEFFLTGGNVAVNQTGFVNDGDFHIGTGRMLSVTTGAWTNNGDVSLQGNSPTLSGQLVNNAGHISVTSATAAQFSASFSNAAAGQILIHDSTAAFVGAANSNAGRITVDDVTVAFSTQLHNNVGGELNAIDSTLNFNGGLDNDGTLNLVNTTINGTVAASGNVALAGTSTFNGAVTGAADFTGGGTAVFAGSYAPGDSPAEVNFAGNVSLAAGNELLLEIAGTAIGAQYDSLQIAGEASLDGELSVSLIGGFTPSAGDVFELLHAEEGIFGQFDVVNLDPLPTALQWNLVYTNFKVLLDVSPIFEADFDEDGDVDSADLAQWGDGFGTATSALHTDGDADNDGDSDGGDFLVWQRQLGSSAPAVSANATVPEPATAVLLIVAAAGWCQRRRRTA